MWRRAEESNPHPGLSRSAGFRDQKALPSLRALRWSESRDSNPVRTVLQTVASTTSASPTWHTREELNPESQFWRLLPSPSGRVHNWWACSESNREKQPLLRRPAVPIYLCHRPELGPQGEIRTLKLLGLNEATLPICPPADGIRGAIRTLKLNPLKVATLPICLPGYGARGRTRTYVATKATGLRPVSFSTHSRARVQTNCQRTWRRAGDSNPDVPKRRNLSRILGYRLPMLSAALRSRD